MCSWSSAGAAVCSATDEHRDPSPRALHHQHHTLRRGTGNRRTVESSNGSPNGVVSDLHLTVLKTRQMDELGGDGDLHGELARESASLPLLQVSCFANSRGHPLTASDAPEDVRFTAA